MIALIGTLSTLSRSSIRISTLAVIPGRSCGELFTNLTLVV